MYDVNVVGRIFETESGEQNSDCFNAISINRMLQDLFLNLFSHCLTTTKRPDGLL